MNQATILTVAYFEQMTEELKQLYFIRKIKVSPSFYNILCHFYERDMVFGVSDGHEMHTFHGIPIEIDCYIQDYAYEGVY